MREGFDDFHREAARPLSLFGGPPLLGFLVQAVPYSESAAVTLFTCKLELAPGKVCMLHLPKKFSDSHIVVICRVFRGSRLA